MFPTICSAPWGLTWFSFLRMLPPACLRCCSRLSFGRCHSDCWGIACPDFPPALSHWHAWPVHLPFSPLRPEGAPQPCRGDDGDRRRPVRRDVSFLYRCLPLSAFPPGCPFTATTPIYVVLIDGLMKRIFRRSIWRRLFLQPWEGRESFGKDIPPVTGS